MSFQRQKELVNRLKKLNLQWKSHSEICFSKLRIYYAMTLRGDQANAGKVRAEIETEHELMLDTIADCARIERELELMDWNPNER